MESRGDIFKAFFEHSAVGMSITSPDGILSTNRSYRALMGYSGEELAGVSWMDITHPDDIEHDRNIAQSLLCGEKSFERWQKRYIHKSGRIIWADVSTVVQHDPINNRPFFITTVADITEQKRLQELVGQSEANLKELQKIASLGTYDFDIVTGFWTSSEVTDKLFGIGPDYERSYKGWTGIIHPEWQKVMMDYVSHEVIGRKLPFDKEYKICRISDGAERWMHGRGQLKFDEAGNPVRLIGTITDISDRKAAQAMHEENEARLRVVTDTAPGYIAYVNPDSLKYEFVNFMFEKGFGKPIKKLVGRLVSEVIGESNFRYALKYINMARAGIPVTYENVFSLAGGRRWLKVNYIPVKDAAGQVKSLVEFSYDVTDQKRIEFSLEEGRALADRQRQAMTILLTEKTVIINDLQGALNRLTQLISKTLQVERSGIWIFSDDRSELRCVSLYSAGTETHSDGHVLKVSDFPAYFAALRNDGSVIASDALTDSRTVELTEPYLKQLGIVSLLDTIFFIEGEPAGLVCLEHTGWPRVWKTQEEAFAGTLSTLAAEVLINERKRRVEEDLRVSQERYRLLMEMLPDGVIAHAGGKIVFANAASARLVGAAGPEALIGVPVMNFMHQDYLRMAGERVKRAMDEGTALPLAEEKIIRYDGRVLDVEIAAVPISLEGTKAMLTVVNDITERKEAERQLIEKNEVINSQNELYRQLNEELSRTNDQLLAAKMMAEESDRLKTAFLANMSHEIRTPLNSIIGFSELLGEPDLEQGEVSRYSDIIAKSGNRLLSLINNLIDISKIESGTQVVQPVILYPAAIISEIVGQFGYISGQAGILVKESVPDNLKSSTLRTDSLKVHQVLVNLLSNAFKFTQAGSIVVGLEAVQGELIFFVEDTGNGIPEMQLPKVFDRFYQVEATGTRRFDGAGLGLSLCKGIVELLGGRIWVISQVGQGSRFCFTVADLPEKS